MYLNQESQKIQEGFQNVETLSYQKELPNGARFATLTGQLEVTFFAPGIVRLRLETQEKPDYGLLIPQSAGDLDVKVSVIPQGYRVEAGDVALELLTSPMRVVFIRWRYRGGRLG